MEFRSESIFLSFGTFVDIHWNRDYNRICSCARDYVGSARRVVTIRYWSRSFDLLQTDKAIAPRVCSEDDWQAVQAVLAGNIEAFDKLMSRYEGMIEAQSRKAFPNSDEAEDFQQEVFLKAYESLSLFRGEAQFSTWLYQIARFQLIRHWKRKKVDMTTWDKELEETTADLSAIEISVSLEKEEDHKLLKKLIAKLPLMYRKPILLHYFENKPLKEISNSLNIKLGTIKSNISRGKDLIRKWWIDETK